MKRTNIEIAQFSILLTRLVEILNDIDSKVLKSLKKNPNLEPFFPTFPKDLSELYKVSSNVSYEDNIKASVVRNYIDKIREEKMRHCIDLTDYRIMSKQYLPAEHKQYEDGLITNRELFNLFEHFLSQEINSAVEARNNPSQ